MNLVSQDFYVLENHTVQENIFDKLIGYKNELKEKRASALLKLLELENLKNTRTKNLSSGQKQRVAIARSLAIIPKLLLLDEPFSNLDQMMSAKLFSFLKTEIEKNKTSVILTTHIPEEALRFAHKIAIINDGEIKQIGDKWQVYYQPKNSKLAGLLGNYNSIKSDSFESQSWFKNRKTTLIRPDKIKLCNKPQEADLKLKIVDCTFNGKCFEIKACSKSNQLITIYDFKESKIGEENFYSIVS